MLSVSTLPNSCLGEGGIMLSFDESVALAMNEWDASSFSLNMDE